MAWNNMIADLSYVLYIESTNDGLSLYGFVFAGLGNLLATHTNFIDGNAYYGDYNNIGYASRVKFLMDCCYTTFEAILLKYTSKGTSYSKITSVEHI